MITSKNTLYICGAGASSAFTAGMLQELEVRGMTDEFDTVVGASSGAFSACFFVSKGASLGAAEYWKMLPAFYKNPKFVSIKNILRGRPVMDVRYLVNDGLTYIQENPIDWDAVVGSDINKQGRLLIQVMDAESGHSVSCSDFKTVSALRDVVAASCALPVIAGIRPFKLKQETMSQVTFTNHKGREMDVTHMSCYDGDIADMYARSTRSWITSDSAMMLTIAHPNHDNKCFPLGRWLIWLEFLAAYPIFFPRFNAIFGYQRERLLGYGKREFCKLQKLTEENSKNMLLVGLPQDVDTNVDVFDVDVMKQSVQVGRDVVADALSKR